MAQQYWPGDISKITDSIPKSSIPVQAEALWSVFSNVQLKLQRHVFDW